MTLFTAEAIDADMTLLTDGLTSGKRHIPSFSNIFKKCITIPAISTFLSLISTALVYFFTSYRPTSIVGYLNFLLNEGWAVIAPTAFIGLIFSFMSYNNLLMYMAVPENVRNESVILTHLRKIVQRTVYVFLTLMIAATLLSSVVSGFAFGIPALLFALLFIVNLAVGAEINRLGAGIALEKISKLINKI